ncbi:MAG TPA: MFS transporter [Candidatus Limnocylindria bacterium]|jgi:MFS family permease|nr:MFS transporter [Candidatus Limnocylindria bacterium]
MEQLRAFLRSATEALSERDFRLLWIGQTGSAIGDSLVGVALAFAVLQLSGSVGDLGLVFAAFALPRVVLTLAGGVWSDRLPRQRLMVACDLIRAGTQAVVSTLLITGNAQVWHLVALALVMGSAAAFFTPASTGLMPQIVSTARLQQANAMVSISQSGAHIFGPLLAGLIAATVGPGWAFALDGISFLVSAGFLLAMRVHRQAVAERRAFVVELVEGWREVVSRSWVMACIVTFSLSNVSLAAFQVLGPLIAQEKLGGAAAWGVIGSGAAIGGIAGGAVALRWKPRRPLVPAFGVMLLAQLELLLLIPPFPALVVALGAFVTIASIVISNTLWDTMIQQHIPREAISRVSGYDWMLSLLFQPIAFAAIGPVAARIGVPQTLLLCTALGLAANSLVLLVPGVRNLRRLDGAAAGGRPGASAAAAEPTEPPLVTSV